MITCTFKQISIADLFNGFVNNEEEGVYTYIRIDGELIKTDIRPPYQREFVYSDDKRNKVIETLSRNLPLGVIYLAKNSDGTMEVIDGQQRIMSICKYLNGDFSVNGIADFLNEKTFDCELYKNTAIYKQIMSYNNLLAYIVEGDDDEKLEFEGINLASIAGLLNMKTVPIIDDDFTMINDIDTLVALSVGNSVLYPKQVREGLVFRCKHNKELSYYGERISFKAINPEFLLG